jgi:membrane protein
MKILKQAGTLLTQTFHEWSEDKVPRMGAALAYYSIFSLAPLLLLAIGIAGLFFGAEAARGEVLHQIENVVGLGPAQAIQSVLSNTYQSGHSATATIVGLVILLFGASGVFVELQDALNTIWKVAPKPGLGILSMLKERLLSFTLVLGTGFLLLVSLMVSAVLEALANWMAPASLPGGACLWYGIDTAASLAVIALLFAFIYKLLPNAAIGWSEVWIGALVTSVLFTIGKYAIGLYLGQTSVASAFGAAGSVVVLLVWVYYSAQILLFGAEFTRVYALHHGSQVRPAELVVSELEA